MMQYKDNQFIMLLLFLLANSSWNLSKLWCGGVPTSDIYHSRPRLHRLLLRSLPIAAAQPSLPAVQCPASPAIALCTGFARDHPSTRASPVSVLAYLKTFTRLYFIHHFQRLTPPCLPRLHHTLQISVAAAPTFLPKYLFKYISAVVLKPPVSATSLNPPPPLVHA